MGREGRRSVSRGIESAIHIHKGTTSVDQEGREGEGTKREEIVLLLLPSSSSRCLARLIES